jgi:phosphatidylserine/phosphatidylglycerophosphate/cardiolipin synthase-like enzyme
VILTFPACVPHCSDADIQALLADTTMEDRFVSAVESAGATVEFSTFTFGRQRLFYAFVAAAERGVRVRGIVDASQFVAFGKECSPAGCELDAPFGSPDFVARSPAARVREAEQKHLWPEGATLTDKLAAALQGWGESGVESGPNGRLVHNKLVLVDGDLLITGSANFSSTGLAVNLETFDTETRASDAATVDAFSCMLDAVYSSHGGGLSQKLRGCETRRVYFTPTSATTGILPAILDAVAGAEHTIEIAMHHLADEDVIDALVAAVRRNVDVRILMDDDDCTQKVPAALRALQKAGGEIRYLGTNCEGNQLMHDKFGIFDGETVISGPANWSKAGLTANYESFLVYEKRAHGQAFTAFFDKAWPLALPREQCTCDTTKPECRKERCLDRQWPR